MDHGETLMLTPGDVDIATRTIWMEARGENLDGMNAVAHVLINRVTYRSGDRWNTLAQVALDWLQFSGWRETDPNFEEAQRISVNDYYVRRCSLALWSALLEADSTEGARHYHAHRITPYWSAGRTPNLIVGGHKFYNDID